MARGFLVWACVLMLFCISEGTNITSNVASHGNNCTHLLHRLAEEQKSFVQCSSLHAVPVNLCIGCKETHDLMIEAYQNISEVKNCSDLFFDTDRINIISTMQSILIGLWNKAFCDDCFNKENTTIIFDAKFSGLSACFDTHKNDECTACKVDYMDLNEFYITMDQHNNGQICYDIQDQMNRTRSMWSKEFKCCKRESHLTLFISASSLIALIPIIFYVGIYMYGKRRENNHGILDAETTTSSPPEASQSAGPSSHIQRTPSPSSHIQGAPSPSSHIRTVPSKPAKMIDSDTESDDHDSNMKQP